MSSLESSGNVSMMPAFNADMLSGRLGVRVPSAENDAIQFVYRQELSQHSKRTFDANRVAMRETILKVEQRLKFLHEYEDSFFHGLFYNHNALAVALICDDYLIDANPEDEFFPSHDFDENLYDQAYEIFNQNTDLQKGILEPEEALPESLCLAHLNIFSNLHDFYHLIENQEYSELSEMLEEHGPAETDFIDPTTPLGDDIFDYLADIEQEIYSRRQTAKIYAFPARSGPA